MWRVAFMLVACSARPSPVASPSVTPSVSDDHLDAGEPLDPDDSNPLDLLQPYQHGLRDCYRHELASHPGLAGKVTVHVVLAKTGETAAAEIARSLEPAVDACVMAAVHQLHFPAPSDSDSPDRSFSIVFQPD